MSAEELQVTFENLRLVSGELQRASTNLPAISSAVSNEARELPGLVLQAQISMRELERLIEAMSAKAGFVMKNWDFFEKCCPSCHSGRSSVPLNNNARGFVHCECLADSFEGIARGPRRKSL